MVVQPDGKLLVSGVFNEVNGIPRYGIVRLNTNGSIDSQFTAIATNAATIPGFPVCKFALQPDGKILVASASTVYRFNSTGETNDPTWTPQIFRFADLRTIIDVIELAPDGKVYVGGNFTSVGGVIRRDLVRLNADGTVDASFSDVQTTPESPFYYNSASVRSIVPLTNGQVLVGGSFRTISGAALPALARLNSDGSIDNSFAHTGVIGSVVDQIVVQTDGKIFLTGVFRFAGATPAEDRSGAVRLNPGGTLDSVFNPPSAVAEGHGPCILQPDGKYVCGSRDAIGDPTGRIAYRLMANNGAIDETFVAPGIAFRIFAMALQTDGRIVVGGNSIGLAPGPRPRILTRLDSDGDLDQPVTTRIDYDGDLKADISVYRPSVGNWYIRHPVFGFTTNSWGISTDQIVPADFDGDAKTDLAVFRASDSIWYLYNSADSTFATTQWGIEGDIPIAADYDGDRKADFMIYRPSTSLWYLKRSIDLALSVTSFGQVGDKPLAADFDGDFLTDFAVFRPANGRWTIRFSSMPQTAAPLVAFYGESSDRPVPADYDGDGSAEIAIYRPSTGLWTTKLAISNSSVVTSSTWGTAGDEPVPADFDGDGKTDRSVFRPSENNWYIIGSSSGMSRTQFGATGDIPTQSVLP